MSTYKNTSGDYYLTVASGNGTMYLNGNLNVSGNVTYIDVQELTINDPFITVAGNNTGNLATAAFQSQGLVAQTSNATYAGLRFNNSANAWQISPSVLANGDPVVSYTSLTTGGSIGGSNTQVQFNDGGAFAGTANLIFDKVTNQFSVLNGSQVIGNVGSAPTQTANAVVLYNIGVGAGNTGVYVIGTNGANTVTSNDELISATRARLYSIIY